MYFVFCNHLSSVFCNTFLFYKIDLFFLYLSSLQTYGMTDIDYEYERYAATTETVKDVLNYYGVAIVPAILNEQECDAMNRGMWHTLEHLSQTWDVPIQRHNPLSWRAAQRLYPKHSMLHQYWAIGHAQYVWDVRQNDKVANVFAHIWDCAKEDLLVSFDGVSYHMPPAYILHLNQQYYKIEMTFY